MTAQSRSTNSTACREEGGAPEPAPGVGEDFVAASIRVSPDGERLAVIGRLNPKSPTNLYVLDPLAENLEAVTTNEDMEIKTGPDDLAWSPGGESVAIVARGTPSTEPEVRAAPAARLLDGLLQPLRDTGAAPRTPRGEGRGILALRRRPGLLHHGGGIPVSGEPRHRPFREAPDRTRPRPGPDSRWTRTGQRNGSHLSGRSRIRASTLW